MTIPLWKVMWRRDAEWSVTGIRAATAEEAATGGMKQLILAGDGPEIEVGGNLETVEIRVVDEAGRTSWWDVTCKVELDVWADEKNPPAKALSPVQPVDPPAD